MAGAERRAERIKESGNGEEDDREGREKGDRIPLFYQQPEVIAIHKDETVIVKKETVCNRISPDPILRGRVKRLKSI